MGRGRNRKGDSNSRHESILAEASKLKQQAERKSNGPERVPVLEKCTQLFQNALQFPLSLRDKEEALFDLGEAFLLWSSAVRKGPCLGNQSAFKGNIKKHHAIQLQLQLQLYAANLCRQSVEAYRKISSIEGGELKQESRINCANALCDWGEIVCEIPSNKGGGAGLAADLYAQADNIYTEALVSDPADVELLTNLGDCCIKRAELSFTSLNPDQTSINNIWTSAREFYERAFSAYANASSRSDIRVGDDIAGLLQNWGAGFLSLAEHSLDIVESAEAFNQAEEKLRNAANFSQTDASVRIALGELFSAQADRFSHTTDYQPQVLNLLEKSIKEGYGAALQIDATNLDALMGLGEVCLTAAKHSLRSGEEERAKESSLKSLQWYTKAVNLLEDSIGKQELCFEEQCDLMYNMACAAGICGQENTSIWALRHLMHIDAISPSELVEDPDLESLRNKDWFISLVQQKS